MSRTGPVDWVRPVENDEFLSLFRAGLHRYRHRPDEGVIPAADILKITDQKINLFETLGWRSSVVSIEAEDGNVQNGLVIGQDWNLVLRCSPEAVLRSEQRCDLDALRMQERNDMAQAGVDRCLVAENANTRIFEPCKIASQQNIQTGAYFRHPQKIIAVQIGLRDVALNKHDWYSEPRGRFKNERFFTTAHTRS